MIMAFANKFSQNDQSLHQPLTQDIILLKTKKGSKTRGKTTDKQLRALGVLGLTTSILKH